MRCGFWSTVFKYQTFLFFSPPPPKPPSLILTVWIMFSRSGHVCVKVDFMPVVGSSKLFSPHFFCSSWHHGASVNHLLCSVSVLDFLALARSTNGMLWFLQGKRVEPHPCPVSSLQHEGKGLWKDSKERDYRVQRWSFPFLPYEHSWVEFSPSVRPSRRWPSAACNGHIVNIHATGLNKGPPLSVEFSGSIVCQKVCPQQLNSKHWENLKVLGNVLAFFLLLLEHSDCAECMPM